MKKRLQINVALEEAEAAIINEYCRVHDRTPQWLFKAGARAIVEEDMRERRADLMTMQSLSDIENGLSGPADRLVSMIEEDSRQGAALSDSLLRKSA